MVTSRPALKFIDLFCGIGGFRVAAEQICCEKNITPTCVFSSDIDPDAQRTYEANFGEKPSGNGEGFEIVLEQFPVQ